jgi:hypothetical protein
LSYPEGNTRAAGGKGILRKPGVLCWLQFFAYAAVAAGRILERILHDKMLAAKLPALFRALSAPSSSKFKVRGSRFKV